MKTLFLILWTVCHVDSQGIVCEDKTKRVPTYDIAEKQATSIYIQFTGDEQNHLCGYPQIFELNETKKPIKITDLGLGNDEEWLNFITTFTWTGPHNLKPL